MLTFMKTVFSDVLEGRRQQRIHLYRYRCHTGPVDKSTLEGVDTSLDNPDEQLLPSTYIPYNFKIT
jgi:hypothetical protein